MSLTAARLTTFLAVVDSGSARAAARLLHVTESAVSASLAALRREVGVALFEKDGRALRLTAAGEAFAPYARRILGLIDEGTIESRAAGVTQAHRLRLGAVTTAGEYLVPGLLATFRARHPEVDLTLEVGVRDSVLAHLADHQLDAVIAGRPPVGSGLVSMATRANSLVVVSAPGAAADLPTATWLLREPGSGTRATTLALLAALEYDPPTLSLGSAGAVIASAALGLGVTIAATDAVASRVAAGELEQRTLAGTPLKRPWHVLTAAGPTQAALLFVGHVASTDAGDLRFRPRSVRVRT